MGLYRDETGQVFQLDDAFAEARGYSAVDPVEEQSIYTEQAKKADDGGTLGTVHSFATGALSGGTFGMSDVLLGQGLPDYEREALVNELDQHPIANTAGQIAGTVASSMESAGPNPVGYLSRLAGREVEHGLVQGGIKGTARALNAMGAEGAVQSAGQYIGHSALEDKAVTAEGVAGALGTGYAFGAGAGSATLGISKGFVAARRMFSRVMDGEKAAKDAASAWSLAREEALQADQATADTLKTRLDEIQAAKREAMKYRNEARSTVQEERIRMAADAGPSGESRVAQTSSVRPEDIGPVPLDGDIPPVKGGGQTSIFKRPEGVDFSATEAKAFDEGLPTDRGQLNDVAATIEKPTDGKGTGVFKRPEGGTKVISRAEVEGAPTTLEEQLAGTKAKLDSGEALKDVKPKSYREQLVEKLGGEVPKRPAGANDESLRYALEQENANAIKGPPSPEYGPTGRAPFSNLRAQLGKKLLPESLEEIRHGSTAELLSPQIAEEEARLKEAYDNLVASRAALDRVEAKIAEVQAKLSGDGGHLTDKQLSALRQDNPTNHGRPRKRAMEVLDAAHEDALMNARSADPTEAGGWLDRAQQVEEMMMNLPDEKDIYWNLGDDIKVVENYEKAIAKAADAAGDGAHPLAKQMAASLADAEREGERKVYERTTRAVDDADQFGPPSKTPKERVQFAQEQHLGAQRNLDKLSADEAQTASDLSKAKEKVTLGAREKKATLRAEGKTKGSGIAEKLGIWEILDLPGMPKVSDLPVVGPLLGAWLKFRTIKAALGRKMGVVSATGDARAAVLAARTRDRIARAVDRSLGVAEKGSRVVAKQAPKVGGILASRIYDDGQPDAPPGSSIQTQTATRIRELAAYVNTPGAIENDVRRQLQGVTDPDVIQAAEQHRRMMMEYLLKNAPKAPEQGMMQTIKWTPSPAQSLGFARRWDAVNDPAGTWERFEQQEALLSLESAEALREVYPQLFGQAQQRVLERLPEVKASVPYRTRIQMSLFYKLPLDAALEPGNIQITQSVYERKPATPPPGAPGAPMPAIAGDTNLTQLYQTPADRNALRR